MPLLVVGCVGFERMSAFSDRSIQHNFNDSFLSVKLWLRFATSWLVVLIVGFAISFYVLPYGLNWFVGLLY